MNKHQQRLSQVVALHDQGKLREAAALCDQVMRDDPQNPDAPHLGGLLALRLRGGQRAIDLLQQAAGKSPKNPLFLANLAAALLSAGRLSEAIAACQRALHVDPAWAPAYTNQGQALLLMGAPDEAILNFRTAMNFEPSPELHGALLYAMNFLPGVSPGDLADEHRAWGQRYGGGFAPEHGNDRSPERRLRVGYLSADLYQHPVASFVEPLLRAHDRGQVEAICYASVDAEDATTERLRGLSDGWVAAQGMSDEQLASKIRADQIDVLVELGGHTDRSRLLAAALRPSPVQVSWLGYPGTTGLSEIDARLTDELADPARADPHHTERLVRLGRSFLCYAPPADAPDEGPPPCVERGHVTFGSFNNLAKLNGKVIEVWARILKKVPGSRLLLKAQPLDDPGVKARFTQLFAAQGVEAGRLELQGRVAGLREHLSRYHHVDVALDPFPYNGTTTTCEALWMGVPTVALEGDRHSARVGLDLLTSAGHPELVARGTKEYVSLAVKLASDRGKLASLRARLRGDVAASPLRDERGFAAAVEGAYRSLWRGWCERAPRGFGG